jgi:hypothetical protein
MTDDQRHGDSVGQPRGRRHLTTSYTTASFASKNAGAAKAISVSGIA